MNQFAVAWGALRYEFRMQVRRRTVWITLLLIICLLISILSRAPFLMDAIQHLDRIPLLTVTASWAAIIGRVLPVGVGVLLADRLPRDRRTKMYELFSALPGSLLARLFGKYLGSMLATLLPILAFYVVGIAVILYQTHNILAVPLALETFVVIVLPGMLFVGAFSLACPAVMWVPLYQFCFIGYWFWGNSLGLRQGIPTLSETILTPSGKFMARGIYGLEGGYHSTFSLGVQSILLLMSMAIFMLLALWLFLRWQETRS